jgi:hypothetical protein
MLMLYLAGPAHAAIEDAIAASAKAATPAVALIFEQSRIQILREGVVAHAANFAALGSPQKC